MTDLSQRLLAVGTAGLSGALRKRGFTDVFVDGVHPLAVGMRFAGSARTLRLVAFRPDLFEQRGGGYNPQKRVFDDLQPGEVLVIEARGVAVTGTFGDILAHRASVRGAAGIVTDGGVRDAEAIESIGIPVFAHGAHPSVLGRRHVPWDVDSVVSCGGAAVVPGDTIVGDRDGVVVIPASLVDDVLADAEAQEREDGWIAARVADGESVDGLFPMNAAWRSRYEAESLTSREDKSR